MLGTDSPYMYYKDGLWYNVFNPKPLMWLSLILFLIVIFGLGIVYLANSKAINTGFMSLFKGSKTK